jgi:hypothetical protein
VTVDLKAIARAAGLSVNDLLMPSGNNGVFEETVEHGHRAFLQVTRAGAVHLLVYRCGREGAGPVVETGDLDNLEAARKTAAGWLARLADPQLDMFG